MSIGRSFFGITRIYDGNRLAEGLSGGERQALAVARAVHFDANVLILEVPTAALGMKEAALVLRIVLQTRNKGIAAIFVAHPPRPSAANGHSRRRTFRWTAVSMG